MSLCPICGKTTCNHSGLERGQTQEQMDRPLDDEELELWRKLPIGDIEVIKIAKKNRFKTTV